VAWTPVDPSTGTWTADSTTTHPGWRNLSSATDATGDSINFVLEISKTGPFRVLDLVDRAIPVYDSQISSI